MKRKRTAVAAVALVVVVGLTAAGVWLASYVGTERRSTLVTLRVVHVHRGSLTEKVTAAGILQGTPAPLADGAQEVGILTALPQQGTVVTQGGVVYRVDNQPVILLYGSTPAWRDFGPGMSDGPDVEELEQDLLQLGYGQQSGIVMNGDYTYAVEQAVRAFSKAAGLASGDQLPLGTVLFEPGPVVVAADAALPGDSVSVGTAVVSLQLATPQITVQLQPSQDAGIGVGTPTNITLTSPAQTLMGKTASVAAGSGSSVNVTLVLDNPPANLSLAKRSVFVEFDVLTLHNVYIVPISALVATVGGGYALQEVLTRGRTRLIRVNVGALDSIDGLARVTGPQLSPGLAVTAAS